MTNVAIDIETQGLDATKYITACLWREDRKKPEIYRDRKELWKRVIDLGITEARRGNVLNVYSHNASFDTAGYFDFTDTRIVYFSNRPHIWAYRLQPKELEQYEIPHTKNQAKEIIKFLDTYSIYKMSLKKVGELIGEPKLVMPSQLLDTQINKKLLSHKELSEIEEYCKQDTHICLASLQYMKTKLQNENINIKRLYTIYQIGIQYLLGKLKEHGTEEELASLFWNQEKNEIRRTFRDPEIHEAYRGGRVEAFKTGTINNVTYVDCNSLYPYSATQMRFPDLRTERKLYKPLHKGMLIETLFEQIGLSKCLVKNVSDDYGLLPIRTLDGSHYSRRGTYLVGTWTHTELLQAIEEGYEIIDIEWSVVYKETTNPFVEVFEETYKKRKESNNAFDDYFYKMMMNAGIGKLAQRRTGEEIVLDDIEKCSQYLENNYKVLKGIDLNYFYKKKSENTKKKPYYAPILPCLINAYARVYMHSFFKKIPLTDLIYTDTDSCLFVNNHLSVFPMGTHMGEFKIEQNNKQAIIYGRKTYMVDDEIKISGINRKSISPKEFAEGWIQSTHMLSVKTAPNIEDIGTFVTESRNLTTQKEQYTLIREQLASQKVLIDSNIENLNFFIDKIQKVM